MSFRNKIILPLAFTAIFILGMWAGIRFLNGMPEGKKGFSFFRGGSKKIDQLFQLIKQQYVDTVDMTQLEDETIEEALAKLDPHSTYIPAKELESVNEPLEGHFEGIGVEFSIINDTIFIVAALPGGPSEALGIKSGDKIIRINGKDMAGKKIKNSDVTSKLRGPEGTKVLVSILRRGSGVIDYNIKRGKIPVKSIDVSYMLSEVTGYIKISNFGATTYDEFFDALTKLKKSGMQNLVLDLRGNPGGYLQTAVMIADEFLPDKKLIVYTQGRSQGRREEYATAEGNFEQGRLAVLIDEGSASASEIVSGAVQDWDRGIIIGRRSFGKGLVQEQLKFDDGSALRLTIARYYTPTGRCIQKSYKKGLEAYEDEINQRYKHGELSSSDSITADTNLKFRTPQGKIVYGGGGITPDIFVPLDTSGISLYYGRLIANDAIREFAYDYADRNKESFRKFNTIDDFRKQFKITESIFLQFLQYSEKKGVKRDVQGLRKSSTLIKNQLKALMARELWRNEGYFKVMDETDEVLIKAIQILEN